MGSYTVVGNLGADPQLRWNPQGGAWATFTICETDRVRDRVTGQWRDGASTWWDVKCSGPLAEHVAQSLHKGQRAVVQGYLVEERWTAQDGTPRSKTKLRAAAVGVELKWGVTTFALRSGDEGLGAGQRVDRATGELHDSRWDVPAPAGAPAAESVGVPTLVGAGASSFDSRSLVDYTGATGGDVDESPASGGYPHLDDDELDDAELERSA